MQYEEKRFYQLVNEAYKCYLLWKRKEFELKRKINLYLEPIKEVVYGDAENFPIIEKVEENVKNYYIEKNFRLINEYGNCRPVLLEEDILSSYFKTKHYIIDIFNMVEKKGEDYYHIGREWLEHCSYIQSEIFKIATECDLIQIEVEVKIKLASAYLQEFYYREEKLAFHKCDIKLLLILYFCFRNAISNYQEECWKKYVRENIAFPKRDIYNKFVAVLGISLRREKGYGDVSKKSLEIIDGFMKEYSKYVVKHCKLN